jgi:hypothetical protein
MINRALAVARTILAIFASRADLMIENFALRQQLAVPQRKNPRPRLLATDRLLWLGLRRWRPRWKQTVATVTFRVLYVFLVVHHVRRVLMHFRVTSHLTVAWITPQLREAFPDHQAPRYLILDRDAQYGHEVITAIQQMGIESKQFMACGPWQNGIAERFVSTARRDLLDHVIVLDERPLQRLLACFASYYLDDRTHLSLKKGDPAMRAVGAKPDPAAEVIALPRLGGLHHRCAWRRAA